MKMVWHRSRDLMPKNPGYYLAWNIDEDPFPTVLYYAPSRHGTPWWYFIMHSQVISETISELMFSILEHSKKLKTKKQKDAIDEVIRILAEDEFEICTNFHGDAHAIYDCGTPEFWAELPYIWDYGDELQYLCSSTEDGPNNLNIEVEDMANTVMSSLYDTMKSTLSNVLDPSFRNLKLTVPPWKR